MAYQAEINLAVKAVGDTIRQAIVEAVEESLPGRQASRSFFLQVDGIPDPVRVDVSAG